MKNIRIFYMKIFRFLEVKFSMNLNRRVFVMIFYSIFYTFIFDKYVHIMHLCITSMIFFFNLFLLLFCSSNV